MQQQHTLRDTLEFAGVGLHSGAGARIRIRPQAIGSGFSFHLGENGPVVAAVSENVVETRRATVVGIGDRSVSTVEHVLSALFAMGVDNAQIEVDGPEIPALDGSAARFAQAIEAVGLLPQPAARSTFELERSYTFDDGEASLTIHPDVSFRVSFSVDYAPPIGAQFFEGAIDARTYVEEIAPARTFGYLDEVEGLLSAGLARGGSLENALVFTRDGSLTPLRWPNEVVRHKVLDLIGDFALLGAWPACHVVSNKSGHRLHAIATAALREARPRQLSARGA